ncbi:MAG TPA: AgmX/PglI C-terminal domain-containing protein [Kofleriaceae bacterium]|nr:AgmX/PglI C-terminal domain-containing protein [Kofleriaceae bacterium]
MANALRTSLIWNDEVMGDVVSERPETITIGPHDGSTFITPELGLPRDFAIVRPGRAGHILALAEHMRGTISVGGVEHDVATLVRGSETPGFHAIALGGVDWGVVELDAAGRYKLFFQLGPQDGEALAPRAPALTAAATGFGVAALVLALISAWQGAGAAESIARGTGIAALALGLATLVRWLLRQDFESRASFAFSTLLHSALLFGTFALYQHEAPFVWPGQRRATADYIATRLQERFAPPAPATEKHATGTAAPATQPNMFVPPPWKEPDVVKREPKPPTGKTPPKGAQPIDLPPKRVPGLAPDAILALDGLIGRQHGEIALGKGGGDGGGRSHDVKIGGPLGTGTKGGDGPPGGIYQGGPKGPLELGPMRSGTVCLGVGCGIGEHPPTFEPPSECDRPSPPSWCEGPTLTREDIDRVVKARAGAIEACYQHALNTDSSLAGTVKVNWAITPDGHVTSARVAATTLRSPAVDSCVLGVIRGMHFPARGGGNVSYPFVFARGG